MMKLKKIFSFLIMLVMMTSTFVMDNAKEVKADSAYLNYSSYSMTAGYKVQLKVYGTSKKVKWKSSNKKIAKVTKKGKVTGIKKGKCNIVAKVNGQKLKCKITVTGGAIATKFKDPTLDVLELKIDVNKITYDTTGKPELTTEPDTFKFKLLNKPKGKIKWNSSDESVATIDNGTVTAVSTGTCTVTAKVGKKKYKARVEVTDHKDPVKIERQENIYLMLQLMNRDRVKAKSQPLKIKEELNQIADIRANEMTTAFSHNRPDGTPYNTTYEEIGMKKGTIIGENVAFYSDKVPYMNLFVSKSYEALFKSNAHKENMLKPAYEYVGISYFNAGNDYDSYGALYVETYWIQEFYTE